MVSRFKTYQFSSQIKFLPLLFSDNAATLNNLLQIIKTLVGELGTTNENGGARGVPGKMEQFQMP
jgi:hypothetical protein